VDLPTPPRCCSLNDRVCPRGKGKTNRRKRSCLSTNGPRALGRAIERLGVFDEDRNSSRVCSEEDKGSCPAFHSLYEQLGEENVDNACLENCEWRENLFPDLNWPYNIRSCKWKSIAAVLLGRLPPIDSPYARRQLAIVATAGPRLISGLTMR
jgi:hypothetical protein